MVAGVVGLGRWLTRRRQEAQRAFEGTFGEIEQRLIRLQSRCKPYKEYRSFLTTPDEHEIRETIEELSRGAKRALKGGGWLLPRESRSRGKAGLRALEELGALLDGYNDRFVEKEIERHADLWIIDEDKGLELNRPQKLSVVRDDKHNLVIAGAGSGKTAALTRRVAYLTQRLDKIEPERILAITFTRRATQEMEKRLAKDFGIQNAHVSTFHSLGYEIVTECEGKRPDVCDGNCKRRFLRETVKEETAKKDSPFKRYFFEFLKHYYDEHIEEEDFDTKEEFVEHLRRARYTTLRGEEVKSMGEKAIADFLLLNRIDYEYEPTVDWVKTGADRRSYTPDFHLPKYGIYIEHWGVNREGEVAPWFTRSSEEYQDKMAWAREQFEASEEHTLIETYDYEHQEHILRDQLKERLSTHAIPLDPMDYEEFVEEVFDYHKNEGEILRLLGSFIDNAKALMLSPDEIPDRLDEDNEKVYYFGLAAQALFELYQGYLEETGMLDYTDMIQKSISYMRKDPETFKNRYDQILVDEFQDVSADRVEFLKAFVEDGDTRLFCVGDDWQSIFSFAGAEVSFFVDFEEHFPEPTVTYLDANYRCPTTILDAGGDLIAHNDRQIDKTVLAESGRDSTPLIHTLPALKGPGYERKLIDYTCELVVDLVQNRSVKPEDVMVLCRFNHYWDDVSKRLESRGIPTGRGKESEGVRLLSVHSSKGTEAPHLILMDASEGIYGFPSQVEDHELLEPVRLAHEEKVAEERRLFYVAITRTEEQLHILTKKDHESRFLDEIDEYIVDIREAEEAMAAKEVPGADKEANLSLMRNGGERVTFKATVSRLLDPTPGQEKAGMQQLGILENETGSILFKSWSSDNAPELEEAQSYRIEEGLTEEYRGEVSVKIDGETSVERVSD